MWLYHIVMGPNHADGMANSVDPDQTAPLGAVWSGSALFAQAYLSENLGSLRYSFELLVSKVIRMSTNNICMYLGRNMENYPKTFTKYSSLFVSLSEFEIS